MIDRRYHRPGSAALELSDAPVSGFLSFPPSSLPRFLLPKWRSQPSTSDEDRRGWDIVGEETKRGRKRKREREKSSFDFENNPAAWWIRRTIES